MNLGKTSPNVYISVPHDKVTLTVRYVEMCNSVRYVEMCNFKEIRQNYISDTDAVTTFLLICYMRNNRKYSK